MKRIVFLTCIGTLTLALTAWGTPNQPAKSAKKPVSAHAVSTKGGGHPMSHAAPMKTSRSFSAERMRTRPIATNSAKIHARNDVAIKHERSINRANTNTLRNSRMETARTANTTAKFDPHANAVVNRDRNIKSATSKAAIAQTNPRIVNNWQGVSGQDYTAFRNYRRQWHDRNWWQNNYTRIILVGGGWWYWDAGYWYPAWGYDPYYTYYPYDGPIYGYANLTPDQIVVRVQRQLRNDGYYAGSVDGVLGPQTRHAIAAFQADHGLAVTSAVDEPTLATLGLT